MLFAYGINRFSQDMVHFYIYQDFFIYMDIFSPFDIFAIMLLTPYCWYDLNSLAAVCR